MRIRELAQTWIRFGYQRIHVMLRREGWLVNRKRVYRIYCEELLHLRHRKRRKKISRARPKLEPAAQPGDQWSMDFMSGSLLCGRKIRLLTIVDNYSRYNPGIAVRQNMTGGDVADYLDKLCKKEGYPKLMQVDNGSEFISRALDAWAYKHKVKLSFSRPGKPVDNAFIESFNGMFRDECLNESWFLSREHAEKLVEKWL